MLQYTRYHYEKRRFVCHVRMREKNKKTVSKRYVSVASLKRLRANAGLFFVGGVLRIK